MICLYFPPRTNQGAHAQAKYSSTVQELVNWAEQVVADAPPPHPAHHRSSTSTTVWVDGKEDRSVSEAIKSGMLKEEGFAGNLFQEMMERQRLASGHFRSLPTYHGTQGNTSTIDFVLLRSPVRSLSARQQYALSLVVILVLVCSLPFMTLLCPEWDIFVSVLCLWALWSLCCRGCVRQLRSSYDSHWEFVRSTEPCSLYWVSGLASSVSSQNTATSSTRIPCTEAVCSYRYNLWPCFGIYVNHHPRREFVSRCIWV